MINYNHQVPMGMYPQYPERQTQPQQQFGFPGVPGFQDFSRRLNRLERQVQQLDRQVERLDRRLDRIERQLGFRPENTTNVPEEYYY